jgi:hypothetical protein
MCVVLGESVSDAECRCVQLRFMLGAVTCDGWWEQVCWLVGAGLQACVCVILGAGVLLQVCVELGAGVCHSWCGCV